MGFFDRVNKVWSGLDFWDKDENQRQRNEALLRNTRTQKALEPPKKTVQQAPRQTQQAPQTQPSRKFNFNSLAGMSTEDQVRSLQRATRAGQVDKSVSTPMISKLLDPGKRKSGIGEFLKNYASEMKDDPVQVRDMLVSAGREALKVPETAVRSLSEGVLDAMPGGSNYDLSAGSPKDPVRRFLYGSEPVETYQKRREGYEKTLSESRFRGAAAPLSVVGIAGMAALDIVPDASDIAKTIIKKSGKELIKANNKKVVKEIIENAGAKISDDAAEAIAKTTDDNLIQAILDSELKNTTDNVAENVVAKGADNATDDIAESVVQYIDRSTGKKYYQTIADTDFNSVKKLIDDTQSSVAGKNINNRIYHITAKTPEQMRKLGFEDAGQFKLDSPDTNTIKGVAGEQLSDQQKVELDQIAREAGFKNHQELLNADKKVGASDISQTQDDLNQQLQLLPEQDRAIIQEALNTTPPPSSKAVTQTTPDVVEPRQPQTILDEVVNAAEQSKTRYAKKPLIDKAAQVWDKRAEAVKLDRAFAKLKGTKVKDIEAKESLDALLEASEQSKGIAAQFLKESPAAEVIRKYGVGTPEEKAFNTYRLFLRDMEQRASGRPALFREVSDQELVKFIEDFELNNPTARQDVLKLVQTVEATQDYAAKSGVVSMEELAAARAKQDGSKFQFYTPAQRALAEETERATMNMNNIGTIGRQKVLQDLTGSDIPLDPTFDSITDYVESIYRQVGQTKVSQKFYERVEQGLVPGAKIIQTGDEFAQLKAARKNLNELHDIQKSLYREKLVTGIKAGEAKRGATQATNKATARARQLLRETVDDPDAAAVIPNLSKEELSDILKYASQDELFSKGAANTKRIYENFANKSEAHRRLVERLEDIKMDIASLDSAKNGVRDEIVTLRPDPTTGLQTILGRDVNGNPFRIEVPPKYAELLQGINSQQLNGLIKGIGAVQKPFREFFTGILNPSFQLAQATYNAVMAPIITNTKLTSFFSPDAVSAAIKSFSGTDEFSQLLAKNGAIKYGGGLQKLPGDSTAAAIASQADMLSRTKWLANPKRGYEKISSWGGKLDQAARTQAARAKFNESLAKNNNVEKAIADAVYEYNNVLPNFSNLSTLVKSVDSVFPYTGAGQAGTRTFLRALRDRPARAGGRLATAGVALTGVVAYNMSTDAGADFYRDMKESGKDYILDNNIIIVMPGASKNQETGEWSGIVKFPLAPELRPVVKGINETIMTPGVPIKQYATSMFDFLTGQARQSSSPVVQIATGIQTGVDPQTGRQIYDETMNGEEKHKAIKNFVAYKAGVFGRQFADGNERGFIDSLVDRVYGAKGSTSGSRYFQTEEEAIKEIGLNQNELAAFKSTVTPRSKDLLGNSIKDKTYYDSANKATTWLRYPKTFEVSKAIDAKKREQGEPGDPLYDLQPQQLQVVLNMMANYSPGNFEDKAILQLNPWIEDFNKRRSAYFEGIIKNPSDLDPMGLEIPKATGALQTKLDEAKQLSGADKAKYLAENDDVTEFYTKLNAYQRSKREFLGLPQFDNYPQASDELQAQMEGYFELDKDSRRSWREANPKTWQAMVEQWQKQDIYTLQQEGALAVYEGIDFTEKGIKSIDDLAQALGYSSGGFGFGDGGGSAIGSANITNMLGQKGKDIRNIQAKQVIKQPTPYIASGQKPRKVNIKSLGLPNTLPTFDSTKGRG